MSLRKFKGSRKNFRIFWAIYEYEILVSLEFEEIYLKGLIRAINFHEQVFLKPRK